MILEVAPLTIRPGKSAEFEQAFRMVAHYEAVRGAGDTRDGAE